MNWKEEEKEKKIENKKEFEEEDNMEMGMKKEIIENYYSMKRP